MATMAHLCIYKWFRSWHGILDHIDHYIKTYSLSDYISVTNETVFQNLKIANMEGYLSLSVFLGLLSLLIEGK